MKDNKLLKNIFTSNILFNDTVSYRRVIVINAILILAMVSFTLFVIFHLLLTQNYPIAFLDFLSFLMSFFAFLHLRKKKNIPQTAFIVTLIIMTFTLLFTIKNQNSNFGIIWAFLPPFFAMLINGKKIGLFLIIPFYAVIYYLAYINIGIWNAELWGIMDFLRFVVATLLLTSISYVAESSYDMSDKELNLARESEVKVLKELKLQAITDALTGMYNRRYFNETIPKILKTAQREKKYISFFILDIDYFKNYNDYYGHQAGDEALKKVAKALQSFLQREDDFIFRIGGEEFAGIVHIDTPQEAKEWISELNTQILALDIEHLRSQLGIKKLTVSIGLCSKLVTQETDLEYFYKFADRALYRAKESGRNRLEVSI